MTTTIESNPFQQALQHLDFTTWCQEIAGPHYQTDPWATLKVAQRSFSDPKLRCIADLFVRNLPVARKDLRNAISYEALQWLISKGVLTQGHEIRSRFSLLSCFGLNLFIDWPIVTPNGRFISSDTYLASSSYDCAQEVINKRPRGSSLDLGSGSGLIVMLLANSSETATGIDIDPKAIFLSRLNLEINGLNANILESDLTSALDPTTLFDTIFINPTWRIVPPGIRYPNPVARVGHGEDGLDQVRKILKLLPTHLAPRGEAVMRFDIPLGITNSKTVRENATTLLGKGFDVRFKELNTVSVERQSEISADTCFHLNHGITNLKELFLEHYRKLGVVALKEVECSINNESGLRLLHHPSPSGITL